MGEVRFTWLPWRWKYRPHRLPDGGSIQRLPPEPLRQDYAAWASKEWAKWESRTHLPEITCPVHYHRWLYQHYAQESRTHPDRAARKRFAHHTQLHMNRWATLGECRCALKSRLSTDVC